MDFCELLMFCVWLGELVLLGRALHLQHSLLSPWCHPFSFLFISFLSPHNACWFCVTLQIPQILPHCPQPHILATPALTTAPSLSCMGWRLIITVHDFESHRIGVLALWPIAPLEWCLRHVLMVHACLVKKLGCASH